MVYLVTLFLIHAHSMDYKLFTYRINSLKIDTRMDNFSVTASNVPKSAFLIASFATPSSIRIEYNEWVRNYDYFSIENFINQQPSLDLIPINYHSLLSVTICSFTEPIPKNASISISYNIPSSSNFSIDSALITPGSSQSFSILPATSLFFHTKFLQSNQTIKISVDSGNLHSFFNYNSDMSSTNIANFLSPDNDFESSDKLVTFSSNPDSNSKNFVSFSVFCLDYEACNFTVELSDDKDGDSGKGKYIMITVVLSVGLGLLLVAIWVFCVRCCRYNYRMSAKKEVGSGVDKFFPLWEVEQGSRGKECCICFENFEENFCARKAVCGHFYHVLCIEEWVKSNFSCPLCRSIVESNS